MKTEANHSAYPVDCGEMGMSEGLTKREYFAAMAMQGMLANPKVFELLVQRITPKKHAEFLNHAAVEQADALIEKLNKQIQS